MRRDGYNSVTKLRFRKSAFENVRRAVRIVPDLPGFPRTRARRTVYRYTSPRQGMRTKAAFRRTRRYRAEISSIRSIGRRARFKISSGNSMRGASFFMQSRTFSSVFNFMYLHSLHRQLSDGIRITSKTGAHRNSLPGHSFCIRWMMPDSVTMTNRFAGLVLAIGDHLFRRANRVGQVAHFAQTFGMDDNLRVRKFFAQSQHLIALELHVRITVAVPKRHRPAGLFHHPRAEIFIRHEQQVFVLRRGLDDFHRVAAGANHVAQRLHRRAAIDVGDGPEIRVGLLQRGQLVRRTAFFERTAGVLVRQHDNFLRVQNLRRLGHEMHAAEHNHVRVRLWPPAGKGRANRRRNPPRPGFPAPGNCARG